MHSHEAFIGWKMKIVHSKYLYTVTYVSTPGSTRALALVNFDLCPGKFMIDLRPKYITCITTIKQQQNNNF